MVAVEEPREGVLTTAAGTEGALVIALALESRRLAGFSRHVEWGLRAVTFSLLLAITVLAAGAAVDWPVTAGAVGLMFGGLAELLSALGAREAGQ